jgi:hypothetical protein
MIDQDGQLSMFFEKEFNKTRPAIQVRSVAVNSRD